MTASEWLGIAMVAVGSGSLGFMLGIRAMAWAVNSELERLGF